MGDLNSKAGTRLRLIALMAGFALLMTAWIAATTPWDAPDEASHFVRALGIRNGQILGPKFPYTGAVLSPDQQAWANRDTRGIIVPADLTPPNMVCRNGKPDVHGTCMEVVNAGNYPPLSYLLPAASIAVSRHATTAIWLTRAANAAQSLAFLLLAIALLWNGTGWSVLGLVAATTPMVFFSSAILNPSGLQITACLAFVAAAMRIARDPVGAPAWTWAGFAVSGVAGILAGPIGLEFVVLDLVLFAALLGRSGLRLLRSISGRLAVRLSALALLAAGVLALVYTRIGGFGTTIRITPLGEGLHVGIAQLPPVLQGAVGIFALLTIFLPLFTYWIWWLVVLGLVGAALWLGDRRRMLVTYLVTILALAFPILFVAWIDRFTGFGLQGREVLPVLTLIPLVAGEVVFWRSSTFAHRRFAQLVLGGVLALLAVFQAYAWWFAARTAAGAPHTIRFYAHATWVPPFGWFPWILSASLGTLALLGFASCEGLAGFMPATARRKAGGHRVVAS